MSNAASLFSPRVLLAAAILFAWAAPGSAQKDGAALADAWCGFSVNVAEPWQRAPLRGHNVPGTIRCAWSGPNESSVVIFLQEPGTAVSPRVMLDGSVKASKQQAMTVALEAVRPVAGMQAMWMVVSGKGSGGSVDGKGDIATTQHWVAVPRERDVVVVLLTCPAADYAGLAKSFEAAIGSLKLSGSQTAAQKAAK